MISPDTPELFAAVIGNLIKDLASAIATLPSAHAKIAALNSARAALHEVSPMAHEPVDCVLWVPANTVIANDYNPNSVATPEMKLLARSIQEDGFTQPIVTAPGADAYIVVDGFHRSRVGRENPVIRRRTMGHLPITTIRESQSGEKERIASTIRHNRARGVHAVRPMMEIVATLLRSGMTDLEVATELGMDADEILRFKQTKGLPDLFKTTDYSKAWY